MAQCITIFALRSLFVLLSLTRFCDHGGICDAFEILDALEMLTFGRETVIGAFESWDLIRHRDPNDQENEFPFVRRMEKEMKKRITQISNKIDGYQERMQESTEATFSRLIRVLPMKNKLDSALNEFQRRVGQVDDLYQLFSRYAVAPDAYEKFTIQEFAIACVSPSLGALPDVLKMIHRLLVPSSEDIMEHSILFLLAKEMKEASQLCNEQQSAQQILYNLYTTTALTEIKGYTMMQFSYMLLRLYDKGSNFTEEVKLLKQQYAERTSETLRAVKTAMAFAPRDVWKCDPAQHKIDETYTELKQLFQGYIVNEVDLNSDFSCRENCAYYGYAKVHGCYKNQFCSQQRRCNGKLLSCEYIDSDMWICPSNENSSRRYEYIEYENGRLFGQKEGTCAKSTTKVDSWWRWLFWHCSYCFCYCDDHNASSDRYFSLRDVTADIKNNRVVTGIKFVKDKQIVHMQVREGELLPRGIINSSTLAWKPVDTFSVLDSDVRNGRDYHTVVWEKRGVDLDDLLPPENYLLTGVRFRMLGSRLNLEIMTTPYNFTSGRLINPMEKSFWHSNDITERTTLKLDHPDVPTRSVQSSVPDSARNQYVQFGPSDRERDAAQSTVPFLDIQPIEPNPPIPISGAGIFHKGRKRSGGFIALKLITYNLAAHLDTDLPPAPPIIKTLSDARTV